MEKGISSGQDPSLGRRRRTSIYVIVIVIIITIALTGISYYRLSSVNKETVTVIRVSMDVVEDNGNPYIQDLNPSIIDVDIFDATRKDVVIFPGISLVVKKEARLSYRSYVPYEGEGTYQITAAFVEEPTEGDVLTIGVLIYGEESGGYPWESKEFSFVWSKDSEPTSTLSVSVDVNASAPTILGNASISSGTGSDISPEFSYPGVHAFILHDNKIISHQVSVPYSGNQTYQLEIPVFRELAPGEEVSVVLMFWELEKGHSAEFKEVAYVWV